MLPNWQSYPSSNSYPFSQSTPGGTGVTPIGDIEIEIEIVFRIAVRGRTGDLARLLEAISNAEAVAIGIVEKLTATEEQCQKGVTTTVGGFSE
jgi:ACT domain-containing protein